MKRWLSLLTLLLLLAFPACAEQETRIIDRITYPGAEPEFAFAPDAELLEIVFPQVLNADAMLLRSGGHAILVDCASAHQAGRVTTMLKELGVKKLDAIINSHPHYDHLQGFELVAKAVEVGELRVAFPADYNKHMLKAMEVADELDVPVEFYGDGDVYTLGNATLTAWCKGDDTWNCNERSAVLKVRFGSATALLTGDMLYRTQMKLLETIPAEELKTDILKYPHHGLNKLNDDFYNAVLPKFTVITNNGTKPKEGKKYLSYKHTAFAFTVPGYVSLTTDGETWLIQRLTPGSLVDENAYADEMQEE